MAEGQLFGLRADFANSSQAALSIASDAGTTSCLSLEPADQAPSAFCLPLAPGTNTLASQQPSSLPPFGRIEIVAATSSTPGTRDASEGGPTVVPSSYFLPLAPGTSTLASQQPSSL